MEYVAIFGNENSYSINGTITGKVELSQPTKNATCFVEYELYGIPNGYHGFHLHEKQLGNTPNPCDGACSHFNPTNQVHGYHVGDLCFNIYSFNGCSRGSFHCPRLDLFIYDISGTSIVIHEEEDNGGAIRGHYDQESLKTGRAGKRIACANLY